MRSAPSALLPILRSQVAGDLLALLYLHPEAEYSLTEAATAIGASLNAVHYEAGKLSVNRRVRRPTAQCVAMTEGVGETYIRRE